MKKFGGRPSLPAWFETMKKLQDDGFKVGVLVCASAKMSEDVISHAIKNNIDYHTEKFGW